MQVGTQILIERMKTHPEEFREGRGSRWGVALSMAHDYLPEDDKKALKEAINNVHLDHFNEEVLRTLAGERGSEETLRYQARERYATGFTDPRGVFGETVAGSNGTTAPSAFGAVPVRAEGQQVQY